MDLLNGQPVCVLNGNEFLPKEGTTFAKQVSDFFMLQGGIANSPFGSVILDKKGVQNSKQHGIGRIKAVSFAAIKDVLEKGEIVLPLDEYEVHGKKQLTGMIAAPIQIGEERYICAVMVIANLEQRKLYLHEAFLTKNLQEIVASNLVRGSETSSPQPQGDVAKILQNYLIDKYKEENNQNIKTESRIMKRRIRLTEGMLHRMIKEAINELDWKTYKNAADKIPDLFLDGSDSMGNQYKDVVNKVFQNKLKQLGLSSKELYNRDVDTWNKLWKDSKLDVDMQYHRMWDRKRRFNNSAADAFDRDFGFEDETGKVKSEYNYMTNNDMQMIPDMIDSEGNSNAHPKIFITDEQFIANGGNYNLRGEWCVVFKNMGYIKILSPHFETKEEAEAYAEKHHLMKNPSKELQAAYQKARKEANDFDSRDRDGKRQPSNYEYEKGKGWKLKNDSLDESIHRAIKRVLR